MKKTIKEIKEINDQILLEMEDMGVEFIKIKNSKLQQENRQLKRKYEIIKMHESLKRKHTRIKNNLENLKREK